MDVVERLSLEAAEAHTLSAVEHLHRYRIASELFATLRVLDLCCGSGYGARILRRTCSSVVGVDKDVAAIDTARATIGRGGDIEFQIADAHEVLEGDLADRFDAIVLFEGLEHLADPDRALAQIERHAEEGLKFLISIPNSKTFEEENPFHVSDFAYEDAVEIARRFPDATLLFQFVAEGSLIRTPANAALTPELVEVERGEEEYANNFLVCVNCRALDGNAPRLDLSAAPAHTRYMRNLERANRDLRRANARLARERLGVADSAAASLLAKIKRLESELEELRAEASAEARQRAEVAAHEEWIAELHRQIEHYRDRSSAIESSRPWRAWMAFYRFRKGVGKKLKL